MKFTDEHHALYKTVKEFGEKEIKPFNEEWEKAGIYPAKELFKKMADLNLLGITKNPNYGGMGLDYSYSVVFAEALGHRWWAMAAAVGDGDGGRSERWW